MNQLPLKILPLDIPKDLPTEDRDAVLARALAGATRSFPKVNALANAADRVRFRLTRSQHNTVSVVARYQQNAFDEVFAAAYVGLELAIACTVTELESGGANIYGADPASYWMNQGPYGQLWEHEVTKSSYTWFITQVLRFGKPSNGVGQKQLTSTSLLVAADRRGGSWNPQHNCAEGDVFFQELIAQSGGSLWTAFYHYNGSGPAAQAYANRAIGLVGLWRSRVS